MKLSRLLVLLAALVFTTPALTAGQVLNFTGHTGSFTDGTDRVIGWDFTTGSTPVSVTALSFFDEGQNGLAVAHPVALYKTSTQQQVATATIPAGTAAPLVGFFRTVAITPVPLEANTTYTIAGSCPGGSDAWVWNGGIAGVDLTGVTVDANAMTGTFPARFLDTTATVQFPTQQIADGRKWFVGPNVVVGTAGELDLTFNGTGKVVTDIGGSQDYGLSVIVQSDGKIIVAGNAFVGADSRFALARFNSDGNIDPSFNGTGRVITSIGSYERGTSVAIQSDGKIVVAGNSRTGTNPFDIALVRYHVDGTLDTTFNGTGKVTTPIGSGNDGARSVLIQNDQKILVCGFAENPVDKDFAVARYNTDGSLDTSFNGLGKVTTDVGGGSDTAAGAALQADGKVVVAGYSSSAGGANTIALVRYNSDGTLDGSLNGVGKLSTVIGGVDDRGDAVAIQDDGRIIVAGSSNNGSNDDFALVRYNADGSLDSSFNSGGVVTTDISSGSGDIAHSVALQSDGKIVVAGESNNRFAIVRYRANGSLDASFGSGGKVTTTFGANDYGFGISVQGDEKIIVAGFTASGSIVDFALVRYVGGPDETTQTPALSAPAAGSTTKSPVTVTFTLPEPALSGSVKVKFGTNAQTLVLAASQETAGEHTFTFDPANPVASSGGAVASIASGSITDGTYTVTLSYQDALGNAAATAMSTGVKIDTVTQSGAGLGLPQENGTLGGPLGVAFSGLSFYLPETAQAGSVVFTFDDGTTQYALTTTSAVTTSGNNLIYIKPSDPVGGSYVGFPNAGQPAAFASMTNGTAIPDGGPYSISFTYRDALGNAAVQSNVVTGVMVDTATQAPTLTQPTTNTLDNAAFDVSYTLPEAAFAGTVLLKFTGTSTVTLQLTDAHAAEGMHSFQFDPRDPTAATDHIVSGSAIADGTYTVELSYRDATLNTVAKVSKTGVIVDTTPPTFSPNFSPTIVYAGSTLANYAVQAGASDVNGLFGGFASQQPGVGSALSAGTQHVTITALDNAGNMSSTGFDLIVRPVTPPSDALFAAGDQAPDAGVPGGPPEGAVLTSFGVPAVDDDGHLAFTAKWTSETSGKGSGLFSELNCLALVGGEVPGIDGATFKSFSDPVIHDGTVACIAAITGAAKGSVVIFGPATGPMTVLAQSGTAAPNADDATFKSFGGVGVFDDAIGFIANLTVGSGFPKVTAATDAGLWLQDGAQPLDLMLREGQTPAGLKTIKSLVAFKAGNGSPGAGRGWVRKPLEGRMLALVTNTDKSTDVLEAGPFGVASLTGKSPDVTDAAFASFGLPTANALTHMAFLGKLAVGGVITKANASGIFADFGDANFTTIARVGAPAGATGANFKLLKDPVLDDNGGLAFPATTTAKGAASVTLWWQPPGGALALLAQGGASPADLPGAQWKAFPSLAIATNRGPVFTGTLVPGKGGVTKASATGVWACDFNGAPRLLFRTGDAITTLNGDKTLKSFTLLNATKGSVGIPRSYGATQKVAWLAKFTDKTQAIVVTEVP